MADFRTDRYSQNVNIAVNITDFKRYTLVLQAFFILDRFAQETICQRSKAINHICWRFLNSLRS